MDKTFTHHPYASFTEPSKKVVKEESLNDQPSADTIRNILQYSKALKVEQSPVIGAVEMVLN